MVSGPRLLSRAGSRSHMRSMLHTYFALDVCRASISTNYCIPYVALLAMCTASQRSHVRPPASPVCPGAPLHFNGLDPHLFGAVLPAYCARWIDAANYIWPECCWLGLMHLSDAP